VQISQLATSSIRIAGAALPIPAISFQAIANALCFSKSLIKRFGPENGEFIFLSNCFVHFSQPVMANSPALSPTSAHLRSDLFKVIP
jgi:hypothetical protein